MKKIYSNPTMRIVAGPKTCILKNSWDDDSRGGIDENPKEQDDFGVKGFNTDEQTPWYK